MVGDDDTVIHESRGPMEIKAINVLTRLAFEISLFLRFPSPSQLASAVFLSCSKQVSLIAEGKGRSNHSTSPAHEPCFCFFGRGGKPKKK